MSLLSVSVCATCTEIGCECSQSVVRLIYYEQEGLEDSDNLNTLILKDLRASEFTPENQIEATGVPVYTISPSEGDVFSSSVPNLPTNLTLSESQGDETTNDVSSHPEIVLDDEFTFVEEEKNENIKTEGAELGNKSGYFFLTLFAYC